MRKIAPGSLLLVAVLAGFSCTDSGSDTPTAPARAPTGLMTVNFDSQMTTPGVYSKFVRWTLLMDGTTLRSSSCNDYSGCTSLRLTASPVVQSGTHTFTLRFDEGRLENHSIPPGWLVIARVSGAYRITSHDTGSSFDALLPDRELRLAEGESTSFNLEINQP